MNQNNFRNGLIGLGIVALLATGIATYFSKDEITKNELTWEEYQTVIRAYNLKLEQIKENCKTDVRCVEIEGVKNVRFEDVSSKKDVVDKLNQWIGEDTKVD